MKTFFALVRRNIQIFFKDKGSFFSSLITPIILLVLYATFLAGVYRDVVEKFVPVAISGREKLINGTVASVLLSSLLSTSCVTVAFCSNLLMVQDRVSGVYKDFLITPADKGSIAAAYFVSSFIATLIVAFAATAAGLIYMAVCGWYSSFSDVLLIFADVILLSAFGTAVSSVVNSFIKTQAQATAVGTIVSAGYGFLCGAYMPISSFGAGLQAFLSFLPGTYGTSLLRNHALNGAISQMEKLGFPEQAISSVRQGFDCDISFCGTHVAVWAMYAVVALATAIALGAFIIINRRLKKKSK